MNMGPTVSVKGTGLVSSGHWIEQTYGPEVWQEILRSLSPEARSVFENALITNWYPVELLDETWTAFHDRCHPSNGRFQEVMMKQGVFIAQENLSTIYDLLLMFVRTPQQLLKIMPRLWKTYFQGVAVEVEPLSSKQQQGRFRANGLKRLHHISPVACGWIEFAFMKIGVEEVQIAEETYLSGKTASDELAFQVSWG